jgi:hypothetical protein
MIYQVGQHSMHQSRSANNLALTPEMQLQEALQRQQSKQMQAQFSALQQQRLLQGLPQQHLHDTTSLQLQQLQQQQHHQPLQLQQQLQLQAAGQFTFTLIHVLALYSALEYFPYFDVFVSFLMTLAIL